MPVTGRDTAICDAALALLAEVGYDRMSMDAVAARAQASKATIYRHWPGKRELVLEALRGRTERCSVPRDTGTLRGDLTDLFRCMARDASDDDAELMAGVLRAMRSAPELGDCVRHHVVESKAAGLRLVVDRAITRGELGPAADADLAHEVASAMWFQHVLVVGGPVDDDFITHVTDDVLIPLLTRGSPDPTPQETK
ncbi:MAG: TetR/AcrR family transcriptional regulator [Actinomycetes bacterium]